MLIHRLRRYTLALWLPLTALSAACSSSDDDATATTDTATTDTAAGSDTAAGGDTAVAGCFALSDGSCVEETFKNPAVLQPNAEGAYDLNLGPVEFSFEGQRHCGRAYNGVFPGPTIDTPAQVDGKPRSVQVNLKNQFTKADVQTLNSDGCDCKDSMGMECTPTHGSGHSADMECTCTGANGSMCHRFDFNTTNLHAHGSHVRPDYATGGGCVEKDGLSCRACNAKNEGDTRECFFADDVISRVEPGEGARYRWDIDEDHVAYEGLNWYHPHIHGTTAIQVASGATGAWIVRGPLDVLDGIKDARERIFLISTPSVGFTPLSDGEPCDEDHITVNEFPILGDTSKKQVNLINGIRQPRLIMAPGQIERWRFLHGAFLDEMTIAAFKGKDKDCKNLDFETGPIPLTQIARDGITMPKPADGKEWPFAPPYLFLSPGYRIDTLLDGSKLVDGDTLCLMSGRFLQVDETGETDIAVGMTKAPTLDEILQVTTNGDLIGIVNVTASAGPATETEMPDLEKVAALAPSIDMAGGSVKAAEACVAAKSDTDVANIDQFAALWLVFYNNEGLDQCGFPDHNINTRNFEYTDRDKYPYDRILKLGAVDHWRLVSGFDGHPFHIHINPFLVCPLPSDTADPSAVGRLFEPPFAHWRDTYLVNLARQVDVLTEYRKFTGAFVYHCHKLNHEDHGMMELLKVCDPSVESCDTACSGGPCEWNRCIPGDDQCERGLAATLCVFDPSYCPEAVVRCSPCGDEQSCPPASTCGDEDGGGQSRCVPGCAQDSDCPLTDVCADGTCTAATPCAPCGPGKSCEHGVCK
jgi:L-ascorbate oxidase